MLRFVPVSHAKQGFHRRGHPVLVKEERKTWMPAAGGYGSPGMTVADDGATCQPPSLPPSICRPISAIAF